MCTGSSCSAAETLEALNAIPEPTDDELGEMYAAELADGLADHPRAAAALSELAVTGPSPSGSRRDADGSTALIVADPAHADGLAVSRSGVVTDAATSKPVETSWTPAQERAVAHAVREVQTVPRAKLVEVLG
jgi:hypothetical protein